MKKYYLLLAIPFMLFNLCCNNDNYVMIGVKDGSQLENGSQVSIMLEGNYPNPFIGGTEIKYRIYTTMHITLKVYTEDWYLVSTVLDATLSAGNYAYHYHAKNSKNEDLPAGNYYYTLEGNGTTLVSIMKLIN